MRLAALITKQVSESIGAKYFRRKSESKTVAGRACGARAARAYGPSADRAKVPPSRTLEPLRSFR
jgi:hypothetical protein